jgi:DNA-binding response OmpR family regulator
MNNIVIVDHDRDFIKTTFRTLLRKRYSLKYYSDRCAALEDMRRSKPGLVIISVTLDEFPSDFSLPMQIKSDPYLRDVPIIIVFSDGETLNRVPGYDIAAMYADAYLDKPVAAEDLLEKVEDLITGAAGTANRRSSWEAMLGKAENLITKSLEKKKA